MNVINATKLYTEKWLKWYILLYFTTKKVKNLNYSDNQRSPEHLRQSSIH